MKILKRLGICMLNLKIMQIKNSTFFFKKWSLFSYLSHPKDFPSVNVVRCSDWQMRKSAGKVKIEGSRLYNTHPGLWHGSLTVLIPVFELSLRNGSPCSKGSCSSFSTG